MGQTEDLIISTLIEKMQTRRQVSANTTEAFTLLNKQLKLLADEYNKELGSKEENPQFAYQEKGVHECALKVGEDLLIFQQSPYVFEIHQSHGIWKISYVYNNKMTNYAGIINIYNFLYDSIHYSRKDDLGYLIGRIFINKDKHYFVEGKRQLGFLYNDFGNAVICDKALRDIVNSAILYSLDFDLLVPPYNEVKIISVAEMEQNISHSIQKLGKRLGFKFYVADDEPA